MYLWWERAETKQYENRETYRNSFFSKQSKEKQIKKKVLNKQNSKKTW